MSKEEKTRRHIPALAFLDDMLGPALPRHVVAIGLQGMVDARTFTPSDAVALARWVEERDGVSNIYFSVNRLKHGVAGRKARKEDVEAALCLHVDVDDVTALDRIRSFSPKATAIVFSGGGYQAYWLLKGETKELARIERLNKALAEALGGDNCHNIDRIMRLPGTVNLPNEKKRAAGRVPARAYLVEESTDWSRRYDLDAFAETEGLIRVTDTGLSSQELAPFGVTDLPSSVSEATRSLIIHGDDLGRPIGSPKAHFNSRSEVTFRVACELARSGCEIKLIAGVLLNPAHGVSKSILEKTNPGEYALRQADRAAAVVSNDWPDVTKNGAPKATFKNTMVAMLRLGCKFASDKFRHRNTVQGVFIQDYQGDLSDDACAVLRHAILQTFGFDPGKENTRDAVHTLSVENPFHPIKQYLAGLEWDGVPRIGKWLSAYLGAKDTPLNSAIGKIVLVAAIRRIMQPGVKFDTILVLEGTQGGGKSTAIKILAGEENFSDQEILSLDPKAQMEALEGVWLYEIAELEGISRADTAKVKAFASRAVDQGRPAYARFKEKRPRQTIFIGTTNDDKYLRDMSGNRRFWPVAVGKIDLAALSQDRDQLWAEAANWEAKGESLILAEEMWPLAQAEQEARLEDDPWLDSLAKIGPDKCELVAGYLRIPSQTILESVLSIPTERQQQYHPKRLAGLMRKLGWEGPRPLKMKDGSVLRAYQRLAEPDEAESAPAEPSF
jgi:hypothetical protein